MEFFMRLYSIDSPHAAGRVLALMIIVDGNVATSELAALERSKILDQIGLDQEAFMRLLQELCEDLHTSTLHGALQLDNALVDGLLGEIADPKLRRSLLRTMWSISDADGWLADAEARLLTRASNIWLAETGFKAHIG
jgi:uncharacterized tellurite resistance protein B-like protein